MAVVQGNRKTQFHPTKRRVVLAAADAEIMQVQVVDKNGAIRPVVVWRCGPDIMFAETMDGLFDADRRFNAPKWLVTQLDQLPPSRRFDVMGKSYGAADETAEVETETRSVSDSLPTGMEDDDVPGAVSA